MTTRDRLVEAAAELLWERGYSATSPAAIQQRAQAGQGSMYHHFGGKAELARAALGVQADQLRAAFDHVADTHDDAADLLVAYLELEREPLRGCRIGRQAQDAEVGGDVGLQAIVTEYFAWVLDRLAVVVRSGQAAGQIVSTVDPDGLAALLVSIVQGAYVLARGTQDPARHTAVIDAAVTTVRSLSVPR